MHFWIEDTKKKNAERVLTPPLVMEISILFLFEPFPKHVYDAWKP